MYFFFSITAVWCLGVCHYLGVKSNKEIIEKSNRLLDPNTIK